MKNNSAFFINSLTQGGAERVVSKLTDNIEGVDLILIWPEFFFDVPNAKCIILLKNRKFLPFDLFVAFFKLLFLVYKKKYTTINSHLFHANYLNIAVSILSRHRAVCTHCVSIGSKYGGRDIKSKVNRFLVRTLYPYAKQHIFKSKRMAVDYQSLFQINQSIIINNPYDVDSILAQAGEVFSSDKLKSNIEIICVGRFHHDKKHENVIKALQFLPENVVVRFLGEGNTIEYCKVLSKQLNVEKRVFFMGNIKNPFSYIKNSDIYLSNSKSEVSLMR